MIFGQVSRRNADGLVEYTAGNQFYMRTSLAEYLYGARSTFYQTLVMRSALLRSVQVGHHPVSVFMNWGWYYGSGHQEDIPSVDIRPFGRDKPEDDFSIHSL